MKKKIWIVSIAVVLVAALLVGYNMFAKEKTPQQAAQQTARVMKMNLATKVSGTGTVSAKNTATVNSSESGKIESINFEVGKKVKKGDILVTFETTDVSSKIRKSELQIEQQAMNLDNLKKNYMEASEDQRSSIATQIEQKKLDIELAKIDLQDLKDQQVEDKTVTAPIDGTIVSSDIHVGDQTGQNTTIATITDYDHLQSVVSVDELDIDKVKVGQKVQMTLDAVSNQAIEGTVEKVSQEGTSSNGVASFDVTVALTKNDSIKIGMSLQADIIVQSKDNALVVPVEAVHQFGGKSYVEMATATEGTASTQTGTQTGAQTGTKEQGNAPSNTNNAADANGSNRSNAEGRAARMMQSLKNLKEIQVGMNNESYIEVTSGLSEGDQILLPAVKASTSTSSTQTTAGFGSFGGMGGGGMPSGGMPSGGGNFGGGGGNFSGGGTRSGGSSSSGGGGSR